MSTQAKTRGGAAEKQGELPDETFQAKRNPTIEDAAHKFQEAHEQVKTWTEDRNQQRDRIIAAMDRGGMTVYQRGNFRIERIERDALKVKVRSEQEKKAQQVKAKV